MLPSYAPIRIQIIEDEALIAENLRLSLEGLGYDALEPCYTYEDALRTIAQSDADLFLLDINLAGIEAAHTGLALARQLANLGKPFIFVTAYDDMDTIRQATRLGPKGYIIKPASARVLFATIQTAIELYNTDKAATAPLAEEDMPAYFFIKQSGQTFKLNWQDIVSMEAGKNYVTLQLVADGRRYALRGTLSSIIDTQVPPALRADFLRVNRRNAVNRRHITGYDATSVYHHGERFENSSLGLRQLELLLNQP